MWSDTESERRTEPSCELVLMDERMVSTGLRNAPTPHVSVKKSLGVHIGTKIVTVNQNVNHSEVIKGRLLPGLGLITSKKTGNLRCSIAVFVCWAFLVAFGLAFYLIHIAMAKELIRLDIEMSFPKYMKNYVKNTTRGERLSCAIAVCAIFVCVTLIVYFSIQPSSTSVHVDRTDWNVTRDMWLATQYKDEDTDLEPEFKPLKLVIIHHSVSPECHNFINCAAELRTLQTWFITTMEYDIPYNFLIGNDGRLYEGRGWNVQGAHTRGYNRCSLGIGFIGDYREDLIGHTVVTQAQIDVAHVLFQDGIRKGFLDPDFVVVGAKDISDSASPGSSLYNAIVQWEHYGHNINSNMTCYDIYGLKKPEE